MTQVSAEVAHRVVEVLYEYAAAADSGDLDTLRSIITDDVSIVQNGKEDVGPEAFLGVYRAFAESPATFSRHAVSNPRVHEVSPGRYLVRAYFEASVGHADGVQRLYGRYADTVVADGDRMLIQRKDVTVHQVLDQAVQVTEYEPY